jgi:hypothetical protein
MPNAKIVSAFPYVKADAHTREYINMTNKRLIAEQEDARLLINFEDTLITNKII